MNGYEKLLAVVMPPLVWIGSMEWRMRSKVGKDRFNDLKIQTDRIESHIYDLLKERHITPTVDVPEDIKNNNT